MKKLENKKICDSALTGRYSVLEPVSENPKVTTHIQFPTLCLAHGPPPIRLQDAKVSV